MSSAIPKEAELAVPSDRDAALAAETSRQLAAFVSGGETVSARLGAKGAETVELPVAAVRLLVDILDEMARGNAVALMRVHGELTIGQGITVLVY